MPDFMLTILGVMVLGLCLYDFALTTFMPSGQGPVTAFLNHVIFQGLFRLSGRQGRSPVLKYAGMAIIFTILLTWVLLLWTGFTLIFISDAYSVLNGQNKLPADTFEKIYYVGYTIATLGVGDYVAGDDGWRVITAMTAFMGLIIITLSITYLVPVLSNAAQKRTLSRYIESLGATPEDILINSFNGEDFTAIGSQLPTLSNMIFTYVQNHLSYPVLHHMHNIDPAENIVLRLAALDEALNILLFHVPEAQRPPFLEIQVARSALTSYLRTIEYMGQSSENPPLPNWQKIEETTGVSLNSNTFITQDIYQSLSSRRKLWMSNLTSDGWKWADLYTYQNHHHLDITLSNFALQSSSTKV